MVKDEEPTVVFIEYGLTNNITLSKCLNFAFHILK